MSEAMLLVVLAPIAGAVSTLLIKVWDLFANRNKEKRDEGAEFRDELRKEIDRKNAELLEARNEINRQHDYENELEKEVRFWQNHYFELYSMYYPLRIIVSTLPEGQGKLAEVALGLAPHERAPLDGPASGVLE